MRKNFTDNVLGAIFTWCSERIKNSTPKGENAFRQLPPKERERAIHNEMSKSFNNSLMPYLCGYRKTLNIQQAVMCFIMEWKSTLDKKGY